MKSLSKILTRYLATGILIVLATLFLNLSLFLFYGFQTVRSTGSLSRSIGQIASELELLNGEITLSEEGLQGLRDGYAWAMLLDDEGAVRWSWQLPDHLNRPYTTGEIAVFSKWYLDDYPVAERVVDQGLLVLAYPRNSVWKYNISESLSLLQQLPNFLVFLMAGNLVFLLLLCLLMGSSLYRSLKAVAVGAEQLSHQKAVHLPERGMTELLARQLNQTSAILEAQRRKLNQRDNARTEWISGVSHDIRTPLSLIMGYASSLLEDPALFEYQQEQARMIKEQSLQIKHLIEDLNLASKLEYQMQPLRSENFHPGVLLRKLISDFYNQGLADCFSIDLGISPEAEQASLNGDCALLCRAFRNLIQNSIRHNPEGCRIAVSALFQDGRVCFQFSDDGCGIPEEVIRELLSGAPRNEKKAPHIMGLRIVKQIVEAHGWQLQFPDPHTIRVLTSETRRL